MPSTVLQALSRSHKGTLSYDTQWYADGRLKDIVQECSSPPSVDIDLLAALERMTITDKEGGLKNSFREDEEPSRSTFGIADSENDSSGEDDCDAYEQQNDRNFRNKLDILIRQRAAKMELERRQFNIEMKEEAKKIAEKRKTDLQMFSQKVKEQADRDLSLKVQERELKQRAVMQRIRDLNRESEEQKERRLLQQQESHKLHMKRLDATMRAAVHKKETEEAEKRKRREIELQTFLQSLAKVKQHIDEQARKIVQNLNNCPHQNLLEPAGSQIKSLVHRLQERADKITQNVTHTKPSVEPFQQMTHVVQSLLKLSEQSNKAVDAAEKQAHELASLKAKEEQRSHMEEKEALASAPSSSAPASSAPSSSAQFSSSLSSRVLPSEGALLDEFISQDALAEYKDLMKNHEEVLRSCEELSKSKDRMLKKKVFDLQKAINTPINALSAQSGHHFKDKLHRLQDVLNGKSVEVASRRVSVDFHPAGLVYCKDLLAKKIVKQGQEQVSSNYESAFVFASLAVGLWCQYPDLGKVILAHFHQNCPFLVPYHIPKEEGMENKEYYKLLGYTFDSDGVVEKQDKYLKRMSGFTRLYAAILISDPPPGCGQVNPYGLDKAWQWLTRLLNLEPQPDITATMLFDFLEVCGHVMSRAYGHQFFKLIHVLVQFYFPKIEKVTPRGSGGPVMRLKTYLQDCLKSKRFRQPPGMITPSFWRY